MPIRAVIFDLDGVIVSTDECHYLGWKRLADEEGIYFDRAINQRCRGVSRMESLAVVLERSARTYSAAEKLQLADRKNSYYRQSLATITPADILPGTLDFLAALRRRGILQAIGSSSRNTPTILQRIGLADWFDAVADGNDITHSKPDPEVFLSAAAKLRVPPEQCLVVEDADAGITAALAAGMKALVVGSAASDPRAHARVQDLTGITPDAALAL
jgi:beta-phosphoglucomutase